MFRLVSLFTRSLQRWSIAGEDVVCYFKLANEFKSKLHDEMKWGGHFQSGIYRRTRYMHTWIVQPKKWRVHTHWWVTDLLQSLCTDDKFKLIVCRWMKVSWTDRSDSLFGWTKPLIIEDCRFDRRDNCSALTSVNCMLLEEQMNDSAVAIVCRSSLCTGRARISMITIKPMSSSYTI